ncbi:MAG TPA: zf-TFIIB domain-containing protein [Gemmatimonadaceae bacterium]|nr:zf-TFIIB domain-containing protein [Gemmatimonadaceae bacterium]
MLSSLNCPTCGAPASSLDATSCGYCGSILTTVSCPSCFGVMFAGMDYCPRCGAKAARVVATDAAPLKCPGCRSTMQSVAIGRTSMHECPSCASMWLDAETFTQLCTTREDRGAVVAFTNVNKETSVAPKGAGTAAPVPVRYVACPVCKKIMNRQNFGRRSGIVIDVCKGHGVWFEANELNAALAFIDSGGFERARQDDAARKTDERAKLLQEFEQTGKEFRQLSIMESHQPRVRGSDSALSDMLRALFS